jgi:hypothetical protein
MQHSTTVLQMLMREKSLYSNLKQRNFAACIGLISKCNDEFEGSEITVSDYYSNELLSVNILHERRFIQSEKSFLSVSYLFCECL